jgi:hypothetical protein
MRLPNLLAVSCTALALLQTPTAFAQAPDWVSRCKLQLADENKPESGKYLFSTRGQVDGAEARAQLDYASSVSARAAVYPTDSKDLLNPYSNVSLSIGYFSPGDGKSRPTIGAVSFRAIGKDFAAIPGAEILMKLVVDGVTFGPFQPKPVSSGMYSVWLDTADTDGDGKEPTLQPDKFGKLANAIDGVKTLEVVLVREGADLVRATIPTPQAAVWRDGLSSWAAKTSPGVGAATYCSGGGDVLH